MIFLMLKGSNSLYYKLVIRILLLVVTWQFVNMPPLKAQAINPLSDLPLQISGSAGTRNELVIYLMGDGGWNGFNQQLVSEFKKNGYGVVALNSRKYFWSAKSPEQFAHDIERVSDYFMSAWKKSAVLIVGYSFGADVASFLANRVSVKFQLKIKRIALISPSASSDFEIKLSDMVGEGENLDRKYQVGPEIEHTSLPVVCTFGQEEVKALKSSLGNKKNLSLVELPGDHRYRYNFSLLVKTIGY